MSKLFRHYWLPGLIILLLAVAYFLLRLPNLTLQPIFADEAIYVRWAQIMKSEPTLRFISLSDGKTPLFMWLMIPMFKIFKDPLLAGRLLSVMAGFATFLGVMVLGWRFFNQRVGLLAGLFVVVTPYVLFFDRMALVDSMLAACGIWIIVMALFLAAKPSFREATVLGYLMGAALLVKTPAMFNFLSLPTTILFPGLFGAKDKYKLLKLLGGWVLAMIMALGIYNILRLGPGFDSLSSRNQDYIHPLSRLFEYPIDPLLPHFRDLMDWFPNMFTSPIFSLALLGVLLAFMTRNRVAMILVLWIVLPLVIKGEFLKTFTARYVLESVAPMLVLAAFAADLLLKRFFVKRQLLGLGLMLLFSLPLALRYDYLLAHKPDQAPLPREERRGYFEDWTAGYGLPAIAQYLTEQAAAKPIVVGTEGFFGTLPDGLWIYLDKTPNITIKGSGPIVSDELFQAAKDHPTFFVANRSRYNKIQQGVELVKEFPKAVGPEIPADAMLLFKVSAVPPQP